MMAQFSAMGTAAEGTDAVEEGGAATGRLRLKGPVIDMLTPFTSEGDVDFAAFGEYLKVCSTRATTTTTTVLSVLLLYSRQGVTSFPALFCFNPPLWP